MSITIKLVEILPMQYNETRQSPIVNASPEVITPDRPDLRGGIADRQHFTRGAYLSFGDRWHESALSICPKLDWSQSKILMSAVMQASANGVIRITAETIYRSGRIRAGNPTGITRTVKGTVR